MDLRVQRVSVTEIETPLLVVNLFEGVTQPGGATAAVDTALGGQISQLIAEGEMPRSLARSALLPPAAWRAFASPGSSMART